MFYIIWAFFWVQSFANCGPNRFAEAAGSLLFWSDNILTECCWNAHSGVKWEDERLYVSVFLYTVCVWIAVPLPPLYISPIHCFLFPVFLCRASLSSPVSFSLFPPFLPLFTESSFSLFFSFFVCHLHPRHSPDSFSQCFGSHLPLLCLKISPLTHWPLQIVDWVGFMQHSHVEGVPLLRGRWGMRHLYVYVQYKWAQV